MGELVGVVLFCVPSVFFFSTFFLPLSALTLTTGDFNIFLRALVGVVIGLSPWELLELMDTREGEMDMGRLAVEGDSGVTLSMELRFFNPGLSLLPDKDGLRRGRLDPKFLLKLLSVSTSPAVGFSVTFSKACSSSPFFTSSLFIEGSFVFFAS